MLVFECVPLVWFYWPCQEDQPTAPVAAVRLWGCDPFKQLINFHEHGECRWSTFSILSFPVRQGHWFLVQICMPEAKTDLSLLETPPKGAKDGIFQGAIWVCHCWCAWLKNLETISPSSWANKTNYFELLVLVDSWHVLFWKVQIDKSTRCWDL